MNPGTRRILIIGSSIGSLLCLILLSIAGISFWQSQQHSAVTATPPAAAPVPTGTPPSACVQPPGNIDWQHISAKELAKYGLPARPFSAEALPQWLFLLRQFKRRSCSVSLPTTGKRHLYQQSNQRQSCPPGNNCQNPTWGGAITGQQRYQQVQATWTLPCVGNTTRDTSSSAWVGLGGVEVSEPLVQAGIDNDVDARGNISYEVWAETFISASATHPTEDHQVDLNFSRPFHCGNEVFVDVFSDVQGRVDSEHPNSYFVGNVTTGEYESYNPNWPASDGKYAEWIVEQPTFLTGQQVSFKPLTDFGTLDFGFCLASLLDGTPRLISALPLQFTTIQTGNRPMTTTTRKDTLTIAVRWLRGT